MVDYYLIIETTGIVPEEDWIKVFRAIKDSVGEESFIKIELGEMEDEEVEDGFTTDTRNSSVL